MEKEFLRPEALRGPHSGWRVFDDVKDEWTWRKIFPKRLVQRAAHGPDFRRFARGHADILPRVGPTELQLALTAVHQPDWKVSKDELRSFNHESLLEALMQYLRRHQEADALWESDQQMDADDDDGRSSEQSTREKLQGTEDAVPSHQTAQLPPFTFGAWTHSLGAGIQLATNALQETMQLLHRLAEEQLPSQEDLAMHRANIAGALGHLTGLRASIDLVDDQYKLCRAATVPQQAANAHPSRQQATGPTGQPPPSRPLSYRDVASRSPAQAPRSPVDPHRAELLRKRREAFGAIKKAKRADDRAFRLLQPENRTPMALGLVGKSFLEGIRWPTTSASPIEDIRRDSRGNFYIQITQAQIRLIDKRVQDARTAEGVVVLPSLGRTLIIDPQTCERAGMVPAALTKIH